MAILLGEKVFLKGKSLVLKLFVYLFSVCPMSVCEHACVCVCIPWQVCRVRGQLQVSVLTSHLA